MVENNRCGTCRWIFENPEARNCTTSQLPKLTKSTHSGEVGYWRCMNTECKWFKLPRHSDDGIRCPHYDYRYADPATAEQWAKDNYGEPNEFNGKSKTDPTRPNIRRKTNRPYRRFPKELRSNRRPKK